MFIRVLLVLTAILGAPPALAQPAPANGSIEGQVVNLSTGAPIGKAAVTLSLGMGRTLSTTQRSTEIETDEKGRFAFRDLEPGIYSLSARRQGFLKPGGRSIGAPRMVLGADQALSGVILKLIPEAIIAVKATDSDGRPLAIAGIRLLRDGYFLGRRQFILGGAELTNEAGECRIADLAPGNYWLKASAPARRSPPPGRPVPDGPVLAEVATYYPDATDPAAATAIHLEPGEVRTVNIRLRKAPTVSVRGRVVDPGTNTGTIQLRLVPRNAAELYELYTFLSGPAIGADGSFLITDVIPGSYYLAAERVLRAGGPEPAAAGTGTIRGSSYTLGSITREAAAVLPVNVGDKGLAGITLELLPVFDVRGTVTVEENAECRFTGGIDSVTPLSLEPVVHGLSSSRSHVTISGFTLQDIAHMRYRVHVSYAGGCYVKSIRYGNREAMDGVVDLAGDGPLELTFAMGERLNGTVVDRDGKPSTRATVTLVSKSGDTVSIQSSVTGANGAFTLHGIRPGSYSLFAWEETFDTGPRLDLLPRLTEVFKGRGTSVTVDKARASEEPPIEAVSAEEIAKVYGPLLASPPPKAQGSVTGQVLDGVSGAPLNGAALSLKGWREATPEASAQTDEHGLFEFRGLQPGFYNLSAQHPGFASATYGRGESPLGSIILGEGQHVTGIALKLSPRP